MARKKQVRPHRSGGILDNVGSTEGSSKNLNGNKILDGNCKKVVDTSRFVEIDRSYWTLNKHLDIAEVIVTDTTLREELLVCGLTGNRYMDFSKLSFRFRLRNVDKYSERIRLGHWPVISVDNIFLELLETCSTEDREKDSVVFSGIFDGPDDSVSALVHLVSQKMLMVRPVKDLRVNEDAVTLMMRVEILENAFDACESLLENSRQPWRRSMISVMSWLRPEVTNQETIYGIERLDNTELDMQMDTEDNHFVDRRNIKFNAADFYEAIKPSKDSPALEDELPDLVPELRPYQRRAAYWMVKREKGMSQDSGVMDQNEFLRPLSVPVNFLYTDSRMFYNPFSGSISLHPESAAPLISGGILADEMGLGKTVELLACIFAHRKSISEGTAISEILTKAVEGQRNDLKRLKFERIECICGAVSESPKYKGVWVQCDMCDAWQHADCVGYSPPEGKSSSSQDISKKKGCKKVQSGKSQKNLKKEKASNIVEMDGCYICQICSELIRASHSPVDSGATLIVCPSPILHQWHAEIIRHTKPGSLKTYVYEGVRNATLSATSSVDISELVSADIVLTTYDVLKDDLSHDSDRNEGDRRTMRFDKRYPVIPTLLTRIFWWRVCLDEAQMVESNTAAATEMALRLHAKYHWCITGTPIQRKLDDLYGLLKFLNATPFEVRRWWLEVIKDPYERQDAGAIAFAHKFFKQIMWRSLKVHVADELQLPAQEESVCFLIFSPIEAHFYQKQHETCLSYAREFIKKSKEGVSKKNSQGSQSHVASSDINLTHAEASKLMHSLLKLRQACCHPQVGSSALRSLQQSPMTMEEILRVLVSKSKLEGEEALRKSVMALNALAAIAIIKGDLAQAVLMYKEALTLAEEHADDFHLDKLINLHIHHNLAEIFTDTDLEQVQSMQWQFPENTVERAIKLSDFKDFDGRPVKRQKISKESSSCLNFTEIFLEQQGKEFTSDLPIAGLSGDEDMKYEAQPLLPFEGRLRMTCESIKQKYMAVYVSKLSQAQQEFRNSYMQVCNTLGDRKSECINWWLEALHHIEKNKDSSSQFIRKVVDTLSGRFNSSQSRVASRFRSISGLKYVIQTGLDSLESSRQALIERILEIDKTMEKPRDEDISRVRFCRKCRDSQSNLICVSCELDSLFEVYGARLFFYRKEGKDQNMVATAEEVLDLQKKKSALNHYFTGLADPSYGLSTAIVDNQREATTKVRADKNPSELETVLRVLMTFSKAWLEKDAFSAATKHLFLFEVMRKEYAQARSLANAQVLILGVHDEFKMATSRLRLSEIDDGNSIDELSPDALVTASIQNSSEKFMSLSLLSRIKGQHHYLKGLVLSKQKSKPEIPSMHDTYNSASTSHARELDQRMGDVDDEACPVCHENIISQKMVFQCGHVTCCKCFFAMTREAQTEWVMCPTCRQHTNFRNIACADDRPNKECNSSIPNTFEGHDKPEASIVVQGSYGTKIEAVTRRMLWIKRTDPTAKVLVFSSWNDVLDVLEHALLANSISFIRMKGGRKSHMAITKFKGCNEDADVSDERCDHKRGREFIQVMLLLVQHGANGLNLLEAKHVILIEPLLNPAAEAQAINRVHRIGQNKRTLVHRFLVKDSVEESIYKLNKSRTSDTLISGNTKNKDQPVLTLKDVESLFSSTVPPENDDGSVQSLMHLPPNVAAALSAEKRWRDGLS